MSRKLPTTELPSIHTPDQRFQYHAALPPERLSNYDQQHLYHLGMRTMEVLALHLGIPLETFDSMHDLLVYLNEVHSGRQQREQHYGQARKNIIDPQVRSLQELIQQHVHPANWKVTVSVGAMYADMTHVTFESSDGRTTLRWYPWGYQIETPDMEMNWNTTPASKEPGNGEVWRGSYIHWNQHPGTFPELPASCIIHGEPTIPADGVLTLMDTDSTRSGHIARTNELLLPTRLMVARAVYTQAGTLRYLRVQVISARRKPSLRTTLYHYYDFRQEVPQTNAQPVRTTLNGQIMDGVPHELIPTCTVTTDSLHVTIQGEESQFPLQTESVQTLSQQFSDRVEQHFPPRDGLPALAQSTGT